MSNYLDQFPGMGIFISHRLTNDVPNGEEIMGGLLRFTFNHLDGLSYIPLKIFWEKLLKTPTSSFDENMLWEKLVRYYELLEKYKPTQQNIQVKFNIK